MSSHPQLAWSICFDFCSLFKWVIWRASVLTLWSKIDMGLEYSGLLTSAQASDRVLQRLTFLLLFQARPLTRLWISGRSFSTAKVMFWPGKPVGWIFETFFSIESCRSVLYGRVISMNTRNISAKVSSSLTLPSSRLRRLSWIDASKNFLADSSFALS